MARLRRSSCAAPGIARRRRGRGFEYRDATGERIEDPEVLERIAQLGIPPAWREVWICMDPLGHLQATGLDAAARKQYLYHERWRVHRDRKKFDSMIGFGEALPGLRRRVVRDLRLGDAADLRGATGRSGCSRGRVLACAVRLLDLGFFRIGSEDYAERNESYGLTTMLRSHVSIEGEQLIFDFPAKSGQRRVQAIADPEALRIVSACKRRRSGDAAARLPRRLALDGDPPGGRKRLHQAAHPRRIHRQGLPHLERHRARGGRARGRSGAATTSTARGARRARRSRPSPRI